MKKIDTLYKQWLELQPIKAEYQKRLDQKFMLEFNYNSNHIEGNTLTYGQTKLLLMFDETTGNAPLKDYQEMKAHNVGLEMVKIEAKDKERPLTETFIRELNKTILVENYWKDATTPEGQPTRMEIKVGEYKTRPNSVVTATGEVFDYATPEQTPSLMNDLVRWFNEEVEKRELTAIELATLLHYRYIRIHPFEDGNGRIARLLVNYVMLKYDYPMVIIKSDDKPNYLRILHQCDVTCGFEPYSGANATLEQIELFVHYMESLLEYAFDICIRAGKGESVEESGDWKKKLKVKLQDIKKAPFFSPALAEEVLRKSIQPLIARIDSELDEYKSFFNSKEIFFNGESEIGDIDALYCTMYDEKGEFLRKSIFRSTYINNCSIKSDIKEFIIQINVNFEDRNYRIAVIANDTVKFVSKTYIEVFSDEDISDIVDFIGAKFADFITANIAVDNE